MAPPVKRPPALDGPSSSIIDVTFVYLLLVESSIGAHVLKSFMADRV
jgi:hypothetical protein